MSRGARRRDGRWRGLPVAAVLALAAATWPTGPVGAQDVSFTPRPDRPAERRLADFLERGDFRVLSRDTVLAPGDTIDAGVLVLDATVRSSGHLAGDVFVVGGDLFLRPPATVGGDVVALSGGYYASGRARVGGSVTWRPNLLLRVAPRDGGWEIFHVREERSAVDLDGLGGFHAPSYDRVDGWTFGWGGTVRGLGLPGQPSLSGAVRGRTEGGDALEGTVAASVHPSGDTRLGVLFERRTRTRERWIRGDLSNTASYLLGFGDFRDYYRSERLRLEVASTAREGWVPALSVGWEDAGSLPARPLEVLFDDDEDVRPNPAVDPGRIVSVAGELEYRERDADGRFAGRLRAEAADSAAAGDFTFLLAEARLAWRRRVAGSHRLEVLGMGRFDVAGDLPRQRWSSLGGTGSLPTLETLALRGPRMVFASATWLVPVRPLDLPVLGPPRVFLRNSLGTAWREGEAFTLEDDVTAGVRFLFLEAGLAIDVTESDLDPEFVLGVGFPGRFF